MFQDDERTAVHHTTLQCEVLLRTVGIFALLHRHPSIAHSKSKWNEIQKICVKDNLYRIAQTTLNILSIYHVAYRR